ncbi:hypothetical protein GGF46_003405 [Coemansia sp. RSA 552]|nr:hypothetical protein GGF46_003405 [Coemansia sp. RSA 552]
MCIAFWKLDSSSEYSLVLAFNRDEFFDRPTQGIHIWKTQPNICAPLDMQPQTEAHRGSWIGVNRQGRLAFLTTFLEDTPHHDGKISRGALVRNYLQTKPTTPGGQQLLDEAKGNLAAEYAQRIYDEREMYDGFNLVVFDLASTPKTAVYVTNRGTGPDGQPGSVQILVGQGQVMGLTNWSINEPWPKVIKGVARFEQVLETTLQSTCTGTAQDTKLVNALIDVMKTAEPYSNTRKPSHIDDLTHCVFVPRLEGQVKEFGRKRFGTRSTTVLLLRGSHLTMAEVDYNNDQPQPATVIRLRISSNN